MFKTITAICFLITILFSIKSKAQDMTPPPPLQNKVYESMIGEWTADATMMGQPFGENVKIYWDLNHQFIVMDLVAISKDNPEIKYTGKGLFGADEKGNCKSWWFDCWGAMGVSVGSGTFGDNSFTMTDGNDWFKETRTFTINRNQIVMAAKGSMTFGGKEQSFDETTMFTKK